MLKPIGKILGLILALQFISCEKSEEKYRELIIGEWGRDIIDPGWADLGAFKTGFKKIKFDSNGYYQIYRTDDEKVEDCFKLNQTHLEDDSLTYYIEGDVIYMQNPFTPVNYSNRLEIKKMNKKTLVIGTQKYKRCD